MKWRRLYRRTHDGRKPVGRVKNFLMNVSKWLGLSNVERGS